MSMEELMTEWEFCTTIIDMQEYSPGHSPVPMPDELLVVEQNRSTGEYRSRPLTDVLSLL